MNEDISKAVAVFRTSPNLEDRAIYQALVTVKQEADKIKGDTEVKIPTPGGSKDSRRADAAQTDANGNYKPGGKIVQVIRPTKAGNVPKRERDAAQDIQNATGVKPKLVPVRPLPKKTEQN